MAKAAHEGVRTNCLFSPVAWTMETRPASELSMGIRRNCVEVLGTIPVLISGGFLRQMENTDIGSSTSEPPDEGCPQLTTKQHEYCFSF